MRRLAIPLSLVVVSILVPACTVGSGEVTTEARAVEDFDQIELNGSGEVRISMGGTETLTIEAEENIIGDLTSEVRNGRLQLGTRRPIQPTEGIVYTITMQTLEGIAISGSGSITVSELSTDILEAEVSGSGSAEISAIAADDVVVMISGSGVVTVSGRTDDLDVIISGSGTFDGERLEASTGTVQISGSGEATVDVFADLDVRVSGSGSVEYLGDPTTVSIDSSGSGNVSKR